MISGDTVEDNIEWTQVSKKKNKKIITPKKIEVIESFVESDDIADIVDSNELFTKDVIGCIDTDVSDMSDFSGKFESDEIKSDKDDYKLHNKWFVWVHENDSKYWTPETYHIIHTIETIKDFWLFFNNIKLLDQWKYNFFVIKSTSHPTWEHSTNRIGGTCSFRIDISESVNLIEQIGILLINECLTNEIDDINGISFNAKKSWSVVKIWNKDKKNNISAQMPEYLKKIYHGISIQYKENKPEYDY